MMWTFYAGVSGVLASLLGSFNLYRICKNQEREIAVLKAENAVFRSMNEWLTKRLS
jgi:uncharacterized membrane protein YdjX (TVP38/TMEM64 family)